MFILKKNQIQKDGQVDKTNHVLPKPERNKKERKKKKRKRMRKKEKAIETEKMKRK